MRADALSGQARRALDHCAQLDKRLLKILLIVDVARELVAEHARRVLDRRLASCRDEGAELLQHVERRPIGFDHPGDAIGLAMEPAQPHQQRRSASLGFSSS